MLNPVALKAMLTSAALSVLLTMTLPEPVTKVLAVALTAAMVAYLGKKRSAIAVTSLASSAFSASRDSGVSRVAMSSSPLVRGWYLHRHDCEPSELQPEALRYRHAPGSPR